MTTRRRFPRALCPVTLWVLLGGAPAVALAAPAPEDPYLAGYAGAVLEREFKVTRRAVTVDNGVLTLDGAQLAGADRAAVVKTLSNLPGVVRVEVREAEPARGRQIGLFAADGARWEEAIASARYLREKLGTGRVLRARVADADARLPERAAEWKEVIS